MNRTRKTTLQKALKGADLTADLAKMKRARCFEPMVSVGRKG